MSVHLIRGWPLAWLLWPALVGHRPATGTGHAAPRRLAHW